MIDNKKFRLIGFGEKDINMPNPFNASIDNFDIEIHPYIGYTEDGRIIKIQLEITYSQNGKAILNYGTALSYLVEQKYDISETIGFKNLCIKLLEESIKFSRGSLSTYLKGGPMKRLFLPYIPASDLYEDANVHKIEKEEHHKS